MPQLHLPPVRKLLLVGAVLLLATLALVWRYHASSRWVGTAFRAAVLGRDKPGEAPVAQADQVGTVPATVIEVGGVPVVPVADRETAEAIVRGIESDYRQRLDPQANVKAVDFKEQLSFSQEMVQPSDVRTADEAKRILLRGTDKLLNYTVQRGDSLWQIATTHGLTVDNLTRANPGVNPGALQPGQQLNLVMAEPYVHLQSQEEVTVIENIPFETETIEDADLYPWESKYDVQGVYGRRQVTYSVRREDARVVERRVMTQTDLSAPKGAVYRRGVKLAPKLGTGTFRLPLVGQLTSPFGWRRYEFHPGIDLAAPPGTTVAAADSGTVVYAGWLGGYGQCVQIDHGEGKLITLYGHLRAFTVKVGQTVKRGDTIGYVGSTGRSTGPHVHFEIRKDGKPVDPLQFFPN